MDLELLIQVFGRWILWQINFALVNPFRIVCACSTSCLGEVAPVNRNVLFARLKIVLG